MSYADRIRQAKSTPEALLVLAEGIDEVLAGRAPAPAADEWGEWGLGRADSAGDTAPAGPPTPQIGDVIRSPRATPEQLAIAQADVDDAEAALAAAYGTPGAHTASLRLEAARGRLNVLRDPGDVLVGSGFLAGDIIDARPDPNDPDTYIVDLPPASPERQAARRQLAESIELPGFFPPLMRDSQREQILDAYVKGGPLWLYQNREITLALPEHVKHAMIADIMEDSPRMAFEVGRDLLKDMGPNDDTSVAEANIQSVAETGGTPYVGRGDA